MVTFLTSRKLSDARFNSCPDTRSKKSPRNLPHLLLDAVEGAYQQAVKWLEM